jgi:hypothetical protein
MPFTVHADLYSIYSRSYDAVSTGHLFGFGSQIVIQLMHDLWFVLIRPFLPHDSAIWSPTAGVIGVGVQPQDFVRFLAYSHLARALFLMKLPYFVADLLAGWVLTKFVEPRFRRRVLALWLLNPIVIFVSAVFGRHDSVAVLLVLLSSLLAVRGRRYSGMALLGLGAAARFFPAFLAPFFVFAFRRSRRELAYLIGGLGGFWLSIELGMLIGTGTSPTSTLLNRYPHTEYLFDVSLNVGSGAGIYLFPLAYAVVFLWFVEHGSGRPESYVPVASAVMLVLFGLTYFNPQYTIWIVPFLTLTIYRDGRLIVFHVAKMVLIGLLALQWGAPVTWGLFRPVLGARLETFPDPLNIVGALVPVDIFLGVARSLFAGVSLWMAFVILRKQRSLLDRMRDEVFADGAD